MGSIGEKIEIFSGRRKNQFIGFSNIENNFILTYTDCITIYDTIHKKVINSWTIGRKQLFTTACIYNKDDHEFVVVLNKNIIKTFTDDVNKGPRFTVNSDIHELISKDQPLVVFECGAVMSLNEVLVNPKNTPVSGCISLQSQIMHVIFFEPLSFLIKENENCYIKLFEKESDDSTNITFQFKSFKLLSSCSYQSNSESTILSLWSNGSLCVNKLTHSSMTEKKVLLKEFLTIPIPQVKYKNMMSMMSQDRMAIVTAADEISILDLKFGVIHDKIKIDEIVEIKCLNDHLLIVESNSVSMCRLIEAPVNLSSVVGKRLQPSHSLPIINSWKTPSIENKEVEMGDGEDEGLVTTLFKSNLLNEMKKSWSRLMQNKTLAQRQIITSSSFMTKFLEKLCDSKQKWMPSLVKLVLSSDALSSRSYPGLINRILESGDVNLVSYYYQHVKDITEKEIVLTLNSILPSEKSSMTAQLGNIISLIAKIPSTENVLVEEFRNLSFEKVLVLISHLSTKLKTENVSTQSSISSVLSWVCLLVDAHYSQIIINPEAWDTLIDLQEILAIQMELYKDMLELDVILSKVEASRQVQIKPSQHSLYHIEVLSI